MSLGFNEFKEIVERRFSMCLPPEYEGAEVSFRDVEKNNHRKTGLVVKHDKLSEKILPVLYLEDMYDEMIRRDTNAMVIVNDYAETFVTEVKEKNQTPNLPDILAQHLTDKSYVESHVYCRLVNRQANENRSNAILRPYTEDMALEYRILMDDTPLHQDDAVASTALTHDTLKLLDMPETELFKHAESNTRKLFEPTVLSMNSMLMQMGIPSSELLDNPIWVITNGKGVNGATSIIFKDVLDAASTAMGGDFIMIPSSIHECLALPVGEQDLDTIRDTIENVNRDAVLEHERLSNSVYMYDSKEHTLQLAYAGRNLNVSDTITHPAATR